MKFSKLILIKKLFERTIFLTKYEIYQWINQELGYMNTSSYYTHSYSSSASSIPNINSGGYYIYADNSTIYHNILLVNEEERKEKIKTIKEKIMGAVNLDYEINSLLEKLTDKDILTEEIKFIDKIKISTKNNRVNLYFHQDFIDKVLKQTSIYRNLKKLSIIFPVVFSFIKKETKDDSKTWKLEINPTDYYNDSYTTQKYIIDNNDRSLTYKYDNKITIPSYSDYPTVDYSSDYSSIHKASN